MLLVVHAGDVLGGPGTLDDIGPRIRRCGGSVVLAGDEDPGTAEEILAQLRLEVGHAGVLSAQSPESRESLPPTGQFTDSEVSRLRRAAANIAADTDGAWQAPDTVAEAGRAKLSTDPTSITQVEALTLTTELLTLADTDRIIVRLPVLTPVHQARINLTEKPDGGGATIVIDHTSAFLLGEADGYAWWYKEIFGDHAGFTVSIEVTSTADTWLAEVTQRGVYSASKNIVKGAGAVLDDDAETITIA